MKFITKLHPKKLIKSVKNCSKDKNFSRKSEIKTNYERFLADVNEILHKNVQFLLTTVIVLTIFTYVNNKTRGNNYDNNQH